MKKYIVSVIIPCLNEKKLISQCLDSVIQNDYSKDHIEVLVIDGISIDGTRDIITKYSNKYFYIKLLNNQMKTQQIALNIGIQNAKGDFIIRLDTHATLDEHYISNCINYLNKYGADAVGGRIRTKPLTDSKISKAISFILSDSFGVGKSLFRVKKKNDDIRWVNTVPYGCYRKSIYEKVGLYNEKMIVSEDAEFHARLRSENFKILYVPSLISNYYCRTDILSFLNNSFRNGKWVILPFKYVDRIIVTFRHYIPMIFVGGLFLIAVLSIIVRPLLYLFILFLGIYLLVGIIVTIKYLIRKKDICMLSILPLLFFMHFFYGLGTITALSKISPLRFKYIWYSIRG